MSVTEFFKPISDDDFRGYKCTLLFPKTLISLVRILIKKESKVTQTTGSLTFTVLFETFSPTRLPSIPSWTNSSRSLKNYLFQFEIVNSLTTVPNEQRHLVILILHTDRHSTHRHIHRQGDVSGSTFELYFFEQSGEFRILGIRFAMNTYVYL